MKKILLSVLLCGFVLNNGYCFDGENKVTGEDIAPIIELIKEKQYLKSLSMPMYEACWKVPESFVMDGNNTTRGTHYRSIHYCLSERVKEFFIEKGGEIELQIFALNNDYFDEDGRITEKDIAPIIELIKEKQYLTSLSMPMYEACWKVPESFVRDGNDTYSGIIHYRDIHYRDIRYCLSERVKEFFMEKDGEIERQILEGLRKFGKKVLTSKIPSGEYAGRSVKDLLIARKFNESTLQTICDDDVEFCIINFGIAAMSIIFELVNGEKIEINAAPSLTDDCDNDETKGFRVFLHSKTFSYPQKYVLLKLKLTLNNIT